MSSYQKKVERIKKKIANLGPILPGSLSTQWNKCGTAGCQCHVRKSKRHGPYFQLSFTVKGKSSTLFVKKENVTKVRRRIKRHKKLKELCNELAIACVELARNEGFDQEKSNDE